MNVRYHDRKICANNGFAMRDNRRDDAAVIGSMAESSDRMPSLRGFHASVNLLNNNNNHREVLMRAFRLSVLLALAVVVTLTIPDQRRAAAAEPVKIRVGWITTPASMVPLLFLKSGVAKHHGKSYTFEPIHFSSSTLQITAISQGEIDIAGFGYSSFPLAIQNGGLADLRIIADEIQDGAPGYYATPFFVRKDSGINKIEDMKGKVAATNGLGSGVDIIMRAALSSHGLRVTRDYTMIEAPFPTHKAILKERKADLVVGVLPFAYDPDFADFAKPLFTTQSATGPIALSFWAARKGFIDKNRAALVDLMEDYGAVLRWYYDPANHKEAVALTAGFLKRPPAAFDSWLFTHRDFHRDLDGKPDLKVVQESVDKVKELGFIKTAIDVSRYADLSLVEEAAKRRH
jgi:NitT/TauT family transport system substrate-binding protein